MTCTKQPDGQPLSDASSCRPHWPRVEHWHEVEALMRTRIVELCPKPIRARAARFQILTQS